jgi:hypothetical protein
MPARRKRSTIDGRSPEVVLTWTGGPRGQFVPARDLTGSDLLRIAYRRAVLAGRRNRRDKPAPLTPSTRARLRLAIEQGTPAERERATRALRPRPSQAKRPGTPTPDVLEALAAELVASGSFRRVTEPAPPPAPPPAAEPVALGFDGTRGDAAPQPDPPPAAEPVSEEV